ncbi:MAG TPA: hypothetical protein VGO97_02410 [Solirubrobacterales bacterium]|jgi:hypothetical protein|nr:hypothetical protein [Solirubrobacterales bacterium]
MTGVSETTAFAELLPSDDLIDRHRSGDAAAILQAPSLRIAAAEVVREGYLLHYGEPRYYEIPDRDLALLAGDRMYAAGLAALADVADVEAVAALARLIADCAEAHAAGRGDRSDQFWDRTLAMLARDSATDGTG